jgi:hypothetical protein
VKEFIVTEGVYYTFGLDKNLDPLDLSIEELIAPKFKAKVNPKIVLDSKDELKK